MTARSLPLALVLFLAPALWAQPPIPWWENPVGNGLTLTDSQRERINTIVADFRDRLDQDRKEAERAERELESVFNAERIDWPRGRQVIDQLAKARSALTQDLALMTLRLRAVLTYDQWRTLQARGLTNPGREGGRGRRPPPPTGTKFIR